MKKSLTKHGNSLALVIEKPILELIGADSETQFDITTDGHALVLTPIKDASREKEFKKALDETNKKYQEVLKKLAE